MTPVNFEFIDALGNPIGLTPFTIRLSRSAYDPSYPGVVMPRIIDAMSDADGKATISLMHTDALYHVTMYDMVSDVSLHYDFYVPELTPPAESVNLIDIVVDRPMSQTPYDEAALLVIAATKAAVLSARDLAITSAEDAAQAKTGAETAEATATNSMYVAIGASTDAVAARNAAQAAEVTSVTKAGEASASAASALASKNSVDASVTAIDADAATAVAAKVAAEAARDAAQLAETNAETAETNAETAETNAVTARTGAETARDASIAAKDISVTKAAEAAASAATAAASIQSDWTQASNVDPSYIKNKPTLAPVATSGLKADVGLGNVDNTSDADKPVSTAQATAIGLKINTTAKDASNGVPGMTLFKINMRNAINTITSFLQNAATAARTWTFPDKDGTVAMTSDIIGRNRIINGDMRIDQRFAGTLCTVSHNTFTYTADRWFGANGRTNGTTLTVQQDTADVPAGFGYCLRYTNTTAGALAAGDVVAAVHTIEGLNIADWDWGKATAKSITISFWAKASIGGNYSLGLRNGATNRSYVQHYALAANTWTYVTMTIPGETSGAWNINTAGGLYISWDLGIGGTFNTATLGAWTTGSNIFGSTTSVKMSGTAGATFRLTGVQVEVGSVATPFEVRSFTQELNLCQRYFCKTFPYATPVGPNAGAGAGALFIGGNGANAYHVALWEFPVTMRVSPTCTSWAPTVGAAGQWRDVASNTDSPIGYISVGGEKRLYAAINSGNTASPAGGSAYYIHISASAEL